MIGTKIRIAKANSPWKTTINPLMGNSYTNHVAFRNLNDKKKFMDHYFGLNFGDPSKMFESVTTFTDEIHGHIRIDLDDYNEFMASANNELARTRESLLNADFCALYIEEDKSVRYYAVSASISSKQVSSTLEFDLELDPIFTLNLQSLFKANSQVNVTRAHSGRDWVRQNGKIVPNIDYNDELGTREDFELEQTKALSSVKTLYTKPYRYRHVLISLQPKTIKAKVQYNTNATRAADITFPNTFTYGKDEEGRETWAFPLTISTNEPWWTRWYEANGYDKLEYFPFYDYQAGFDKKEVYQDRYIDIVLDLKDSKELNLYNSIRNNENVLKIFKTQEKGETINQRFDLLRLVRDNGPTSNNSFIVTSGLEGTTMLPHPVTGKKVVAWVYGSYNLNGAENGYPGSDNYVGTLELSVGSMAPDNIVREDNLESYESIPHYEISPSDLFKPENIAKIWGDDVQGLKLVTAQLDEFNYKHEMANNSQKFKLIRTTVISPDDNQNYYKFDTENESQYKKVGIGRRSPYTFKTSDTFREFQTTDAYRQYMNQNAQAVNMLAKQQNQMASIQETNARLQIGSGLLSGLGSVMGMAAGSTAGDASALTRTNSVSQGSAGMLSAVSSITNGSFNLATARNEINMTAAKYRDMVTDSLKPVAYATEVGVYDVLDDGGFDSVEIQYWKSPERLLNLLAQFWNKYGYAMGNRLSDPYSHLFKHARFDYLKTDFESVYNALLPTTSTQMSKILARSFADEGIRFWYWSVEYADSFEIGDYSRNNPLVTIENK